MESAAVGAAVCRTDAAGAAAGPPGLAVTSAYGRLVGGAQQSPMNVRVAAGLAADGAANELSDVPGVDAAAAQAETTSAAAMRPPNAAKARPGFAGRTDCAGIASPYPSRHDSDAAAVWRRWIRRSVN